MTRAALVGALVSGSLATSARADTIAQPIIGGQPSMPEQFPSVVAVSAGDGALCTGTLIAPEWVLTAAHCIELAPGNMVRVAFHTIDVNQPMGIVIMSAMTIAKPGFSRNMLGKNDIGLVKLSRPVSDIVPIPVNLTTEKAPVGIEVTMVGYGQIMGGGGPYGVQRYVPQASIACPATMGSDADLLCFNQTTGKGKCSGDSGGPSFAMIDGRLTQVGVTSFGDLSCAMYGADTRTDAERAFLIQHAGVCATDADCATGRNCFLSRCIAEPFGDHGLGADCTTNTDCDSQTCSMLGDETHCSMPCTVGDTLSCPSGFECIAPGGAASCWPRESAGCCDARGHNAATMLLGIVLFGPVLRRRRVKRRS